jgi:DNA-binding GntR family transcriptional regulator
MARRLSLTEQAYQRLRADLLACRLLPGEKLNINVLCKRMGMSLPSVREALSRLTSEGLVTAERSKGFRAAPISAKDLIDLTMVRIEIESLCLRRAIVLGDETWQAMVESAYDKLIRTPFGAPNDPRRISDAFHAAHTAYHDALASSCDSEWLIRLRKLLQAQSERYRRLSVPLTSSYVRDHNGEHKAIMDAVVSRDVTRAVTLLETHLQATTQLLIDAQLPISHDRHTGKSDPVSKLEPLITLLSKAAANAKPSSAQPSKQIDPSLVSARAPRDR